MTTSILDTPESRLARLHQRRADRDAGITESVRKVPGLDDWICQQVRRDLENADRWGKQSVANQANGHQANGKGAAG
jgi:hypothetical protein